MRTTSSLKFVIPAMLMVAGPLAAQCHMQYNVSVYNDASISDDLSTVYGSSNFFDNSTLCTCGHGQYQDFLTIYAPDGSHVTQNQTGTESNTYMATTAGAGTYTVVSTASLYCSCAAEDVQSGGQSATTQVTPYVQVYSVSTDTNTIYVNSSNGSPNCGTATVQALAQGLGLTGVPIPTVTVSLAGASSTPPGVTISVANPSPSSGQLYMTSSPSNFTFHVCATGLPQNQTSGTMTVQGAIIGVSPSPWVLKDPAQPSNATASFTVRLN